MILALAVGFVDFGYEFCGLWLWLWSWLVSFLGFCSVLLHWFGCVDFSAILFCSASLVLMGTVGLWLCSHFYGFDGGCWAKIAI